MYDAVTYIPQDFQRYTYSHLAKLAVASGKPLDVPTSRYMIYFETHSHDTQIKDIIISHVFSNIHEVFTHLNSHQPSQLEWIQQELLNTRKAPGSGANEAGFGAGPKAADRPAEPARWVMDDVFQTVFSAWNLGKIMVFPGFGVEVFFIALE